MTIRTLGKSYIRSAPWGPEYFTRRNLCAGYFTEEGRLVAGFLNPRSDVLIIGSGNGREAFPILNEGHRIICLDFALGYLLVGKKLLELARNTTTYFVQGEMIALPFREAAFSFVFFSLYSCAGEKRFAMLNDIRRLLQPHGHVLVSVITPAYRIPHGTFQRWGKWRVFSNIAELRAEMTINGFEVLEGGIDPVRPEYIMAILRVIQ